MTSTVDRKRKYESCEEVSDGDFKGFALEKDAASNTIVALSSHTCRDADRWQKMPSLEAYPHLERLDLYKNRYINNLDGSIAQLDRLQILEVTRCKRLQTIPPTISQLQMLQVLDLTDSESISHLPDSIGELKKYVIPLNHLSSDDFLSFQRLSLSFLNSV